MVPSQFFGIFLEAKAKMLTFKHGHFQRPKSSHFLRLSSIAQGREEEK
jgi:hypothetical protein